jgi:hypothetical protein
MLSSSDASVTRAVRSVPLAPAAVAVAGAGLVGFTALNDPTQRSILPPCPFHAATGLWCPGCGLTRAAHHLLRGDVAAALSSNLLLPAVIVLGLTLWWSWWWTARGRTPVHWAARAPSAVWAVLLAVTVAYGVARNLPGLEALAP